MACFLACRDAEFQFMSEDIMDEETKDDPQPELPADVQNVAEGGNNGVGNMAMGNEGGGRDDSPEDIIDDVLAQLPAPSRRDFIFLYGLGVDFHSGV